MKNNKINTVINFQSKKSSKNDDEIKKFNDLYLSKLISIINKIHQSLPMPPLKKDQLLRIFENLEQIINIFKEILQKYSFLQKNLYQYESMLLRDEQTIRILYKNMLINDLNEDSMEERIKILLIKEKEYELVKEKTGANVYNGKLIYNDHKDNEIFILKEENSKLKKLISRYEKIISDKKKIIDNLTLQISKLKKKIQNLKTNINNKKIIHVPNVSINLGDKNSHSNINSNVNNCNIIKNTYNKKDRNHNNKIINSKSKTSHMHCLSWNRNYISTLNLSKILKNKEQITYGNISRNKNKKILNSKTNKNISHNYYSDFRTSGNLIDFNEGSELLILKRNKLKFLGNNKGILYNMGKNKFSSSNSYISSKNSVFTPPKSVFSKSNSKEKQKNKGKKNSINNKTFKYDSINSKMNESNLSERNNKTFRNIKINVKPLKFLEERAKNNKNSSEKDRINFSISYLKNKIKSHKKGKI